MKEFTERLRGSDPGQWYQEEKKQSREMFKRVEMWEFGDQIDAEEEEKARVNSEFLGWVEEGMLGAIKLNMRK